MNHEIDMIIRQMKETNDRLKEMVKEVQHLNRILRVLAVYKIEMKEKEDDQHRRSCDEWIWVADMNNSTNMEDDLK